MEIPRKETLEIEFKSDSKRFPDKELIEEAVAFSNTSGGLLYLGVEDDGTITGLHPVHKDLIGLSALIANNTRPTLRVSVSMMEKNNKKIAVIRIPQSSQLVSTVDGYYARRQLKLDGSPEKVAMEPSDVTSRLSYIGAYDTTDQIIMGLEPNSALNPVERARLRDIIRQYQGDSILLELKDSDLDKALGFVKMVDGKLKPTITGILMIGYEEAITEYVPTHEAAFQVMSGTDVLVNEFFRTPMLKLFETLLVMFRARVEEKEFMAGLIRVPVPNYDEKVFREALVNALIHRDYNLRGAVYIRFEKQYLNISNPGGFVEGVTLKNLLVTEPKPRNRSLADATKRIGISERTGRGIDAIYYGLARFGSPLPDYSRSDRTSVVLRIRSNALNEAFMKLIFEEQNKRQKLFELDEMILLSKLFFERNLKIDELSDIIQKNIAETRESVEGLVETGLVKAHGQGKGRFYTLSQDSYSQTGKKSAYVRQQGFSNIQREEMIKNFVITYEKITRADVIELCRVTKDQAYIILSSMVKKGILKKCGAGKGTFYALND